LRHYATSQKVVGSSPDKVIECFFNLPKPSRCIIALGFTKPLTEMSTRRSLWGVYILSVSARKVFLMVLQKVTSNQQTNIFIHLIKSSDFSEYVNENTNLVYFFDGGTATLRNLIPQKQSTAIV
jgi:hypothetical protein